ncbi:glycoside hydrolase family 31 protein [Leptolyngbya sp. KIOST-1]|uniref:glycoside hydrolase family 31 protein n=1 Tax=Leptolyngbya sp. KIOST-1 TaxID=1229172 RepID=UPI00056B9842|nr:glycoside hydrolase family 31 protein [Leptolyngbya sp. KIOST-1]
MAGLKPLWLGLKFILQALWFLRYSPYALWYSWRRDQRDRPYRSATAIAPTPVGKGLGASHSDRGVQIDFEQASLELVFLTPDFVRVTWQPGRLPLPYALADRDWPAVATELEERAKGWRISSPDLTINVGWDGGIAIADRSGQLIRQERPPQRRGEGWQHSARLRDEECLYGLGERAAAFNLRAPVAPGQPKTYGFWNYDPGNIYQPGTDPMYISIPVYLGLHRAGSYLVFYENTFRGELTLAHGGADHSPEPSATATFEAGALRYYLAVGAPPLLLERYTQLTGRPPLPPRWTLGYQQSHWGYRTEANLRQEVQTFQAHDLPLAAVHLDIDCQVNHRAFTLDPQRFPAFPQFTAELAAAGVRVVAINNPGIQHNRHSNLFLEGQILDAFCTYADGDLVVAPVWPGRSVFPDFTNPVVRDWWSRQFAYLLQAGVAGFWNDMNEPAAFVAWGDPTLPLATQHCLEGRGGDHREAHNVYGLLETRSAFESLRRHRPQMRPFVVTRSGWAGMQRYAWTWTGDIVSTWEALRQTVATLLGLGLSGVAFCGSDIGGFLGNPGGELYLRWFQMATFTVFYRTHSAISVGHRAPWTYGEPYLGILRRILRLREQLMPYLYTLAWEASDRGYPPVRPLFWLNPSDATLWNREDAFCLGDALLVCPVLGQGLRSRPCDLPPGDWYNFWDDTRSSGGQTVELAAPLEQIPLLVRGGSILPLAEGDTLTLHLYPPSPDSQRSAAGQRLYSDAGEGYGDWRIDHWHLNQQGQTLTLTWQSQGDYAFPYGQVTLHLHGPALGQAWVDGQTAAVDGQTITCQTFEQVRLQI